MGFWTPVKPLLKIHKARYKTDRLLAEKFVLMRQPCPRFCVSQTRLWGFLSDSREPPCQGAPTCFLKVKGSAKSCCESVKLMIAVRPYIRRWYYLWGCISVSSNLLRYTITRAYTQKYCWGVPGGKYPQGDCWVTTPGDAHQCEIMVYCYCCC